MYNLKYKPSNKPILAEYWAQLFNIVLNIWVMGLYKYQTDNFYHIYLILIKYLESTQNIFTIMIILLKYLNYIGYTSKKMR